MLCTSSDLIDDAGDLDEFSGKGSVTIVQEEFDNAIADRPGQQQPGEIPACWRTSTSGIEFEARAVHSGNTDMLATSCEHFDLV